MAEITINYDKTISICTRCKAEVHFAEPMWEKPCLFCGASLWLFYHPVIGGGKRTLSLCGGYFSGASYSKVTGEEKRNLIYETRLDK